jgi:hypothetical protein
MSTSIITKAVSLGLAAAVTLTVVASLDALARSEQASALAAAPAATQTACAAPAGPRS